MPALAPKSIDWIATAPVQIEQSVAIDAPVERVWDHLVDNNAWINWFPGMSECRFTSEPPHSVDSIRSVHLDQFKVTERIIAWEPSRRWGMTVLEINAPVLAAMAEEATLTADSSGATKLDFRIGIELSSIGRLLRRPLVGRQTTGLKTALANLRSECEQVART